MSNMISPDEMNALLRREEQPMKQSLNQWLSTHEQEVFTELMNVAFGSAFSGLSTILGQPVDIGATHPRPYVEAVDAMNRLALSFSYAQGLSGSFYLVIDEIEALRLVDMMRKEDISSAEGNDAAEALNEMTAALQSSIDMSFSAIYNHTVSSHPPQLISAVDSVEQLIGSQAAIEVPFVLTVGEQMQVAITVIVSSAQAKYIVEQLLSQSPALKEAASAAALVMSEPSTETLNYPGETLNFNETTSKMTSGGGQLSQPKVQPVQFSNFEQVQQQKVEMKNLDMLLDIPLQVTVELGRTRKLVKDILELSQGSIIELDKLAGEPVDILINNKLIAKGEVVVIDENFGVRVTDILSKADRLTKLK